MHICIFEDTSVNNFFPLTYLRPVYDLRCGVLSLREKIESAFGAKKVVLHARAYLTDYLGEQYPSRHINQLSDDDTWFINGRVLADESFKKTIRSHRSGEKVFYSDNSVAAAFVEKKNISRMTQLAQGELFDENTFKHLPSENISCRLFSYPWELMNANAEEIVKDFSRRDEFPKRLKKSSSSSKSKIYKGAHLLNKKNIVIGTGTSIKPGAVLDAEKGPIIIGNSVTIMPNAFIEGPAFIGENTLVKVGAKIYHGTSIGEWCKVGGEIEQSIIQSYSNKQHEGFLGHSYLGSWINIGADTNTSDLKNTYGTIKVYVNNEQVDTKLLFVGLTMGDHSKTGINMMFDTGSVVGVSCNLYGADMPPKFIPSFSWGRRLPTGRIVDDSSSGADGFATFSLDKSLDVARRMMSRRNVKLTSAYETLMRHIFSISEHERQ